ncbi:bromodomain-containing protein 13 [Hibiscus trionum]|uniref:Bromodomain-containing protein 13 n=1 Tax=Hibiscus trionum TaxID=183268 RepID=A0A9W7GQ95_HIBTR|nr:bromodomain-containing protein 13 [Hibiscus trionum]
MGQIVKRKKKGRPSKADLAKRGSSPSAPAESELRRSHRRRNVRYNIDFDDYLDEDFEEEDDEEERRREKKLKLILKLNQDQEADPPSPLPHGRGRVIVPSSARGRRTAKEEVEEEEDDAEEEDEEEESERRKRKIKKRRINVRDEVDDDDEEEQQVDDDEEEEEDDGHVDVDAEMGGRKGESKGQDSVSGTPSHPPSGIPLPDKTTLELLLDSLQTKDRFGVYSEPVDPEELPDYHDVVEHPMDFSTMRKKLRNGSYSTLEQFESDAFLICSNAMQYNAPDTIYYRQARSIQRLAEKKFRKLRIDAERSKEDSKIEQKTKSNFVAKKQIKKPLHLTTQEPVGSDFSSGVILATAGDILNSSVTIQANVCERPSHTDLLIDGNSSVADYNIEKAEELSSGKGLLSKFGRKSSTLDDNRRATYNISNQPVVRSDSIFTTFEAEIKQLVAVGLQAEFSYARSLARFAATLGPVAWKVASRKIEQALPIGCKFGRGWVGEYEPLPTPVLTFESRVPKESTLFTKLQRAADVWRDDTSHRTPVPASDVRKDVATYKNQAPSKPHPFDVPVSEGKPSSFRPTNGPTSEGRSSLFAVAGPQLGKPVNTIHQQHNLTSRICESESKVTKQVELNLPPTANQNNADLIAEKKNSNKLGKLASKSKEMISRNMNPAQAVPPKQNENNVALDGGLPDGKVPSSCLNNRAINLSSEGIPTQMEKSAAFYSHGQEQGISDPVQLMRSLAEKAQKQQNSSNQFPVDTPQDMPSVPPIRRDESSNAAAAAARAWMSIGAGAFKEAAENPGTLKGKISAESLYNPARELHPQASQLPGQFALSAGMQFQPQQNSFPFHGFAPQQVRMMSEAQFQNRPMVFPQLVTTDLSRFQVQPHWQGLSPRAQPRQKQDSLPPDLNIGFQSPGSPVKQSSGVLVDSQQPDLALQL